MNSARAERHDDHGPHDGAPDAARPAGQCQEAIATLYTFLDGELTVERRAQIRAHLDECSPCLEAYDFEAELKVVVAKCCRDQVPEGLRLRVAQALADAHQDGVDYGEA
jgi:mycothiol system anti-sigma-R factor